tara:strand:- start:53 stop:643 length:591 start_codon:yes stop_codon:yes gene_type:complete
MKFIIYIIAFFIFTSCQTETSLKLDIPRNQSVLKLYNSFKNQVNQLGLSANPNSTIIRLWETGPYTSHQLHQITIDSVNSTLCSFNIYDSWQTDPFVTNVDSVIIKCQTISSKNIYQDLINLGLDTLKSQSDYSNFKDNISDGIGYSLEIINTKKHKFIFYHCPASFNSKPDKTFLSILNKLERLIKLNRPLGCGK